MDRAHLSGTSATPPTAPVSPSIGYPTAGNPATSTPPTFPGPYFYHMIVEELLAVITAAGITPAQGTLTQLKQAMDSLYGSSKQIQPITASVAANALTLTLNPTTLSFRATPLTSGTVNNRSIGSPVSLVISSGSTLGTANATQSRIALLAIDNAGTVELAAVNLAGGNNLDETTLITTVAEGGAGAADSANVIYSATARTSVPFRVVGYVESTQATAGTWATAPSTIQGEGGQAIAAMSSLGYSQTWQNVAGSRANNTTYTNTTGRPICVMASLQSSAAAQAAVATINGITCQGSCATAAGNSAFTSFVVPAGGTYLISIPSFSAIGYWIELR